MSMVMTAMKSLACPAVMLGPCVPSHSQVISPGGGSSAQLSTMLSICTHSVESASLTNRGLLACRNASSRLTFPCPPAHQTGHALGRGCSSRISLTPDIDAAWYAFIRRGEENI